MLAKGGERRLAGSQRDQSQEGRALLPEETEQSGRDLLQRKGQPFQRTDRSTVCKRCVLNRCAGLVVRCPGRCTALPGNGLPKDTVCPEVVFLTRVSNLHAGNHLFTQNVWPPFQYGASF